MIPEKQNSLKAGAFLSFGVFLIMLVWAIYYYKERILFADASHIAFSAINGKALQIQQYRFGAFITQMVPVIGAWLGLSVKAIAIAYSASFNLFYLFVAAVLLFGFKAYRLLVLYAFYWLLVTTHAFFWPNNEVHQGIAYMFLLFPSLLAAGERKLPVFIPVLLLILLGTTALFCHPLILPPFIFLWVYLIAEKTYWPFDRTKTILLSIVAAVLCAAKLYVSKKYAGYDAGLIDFGKLHPADIAGAFSSPLAKEIYRHVSLNYWILPIVSLIGIATLVYQRNYFLAIWSLGCTIVFFILLCLTFGGYMEFYSESEIMAGIIIATAPFVFATLASINRELGIAILLFIIISRLGKISDSHGQFQDRVKGLSEILDKMRKQHLTKLVLVKKETYIEWRWMVEWGFATESIMLSSIQGDKPVLQFVIMAPDELKTRLPKHNSDLIACFDTLPVQKTDLKYFPFDTSHPYTVLSYEDFMK